MDLPYDRLGVPDRLRFAITPDAPVETRRALAAAPLAPEAELGVLTVLAGDPEPAVAETATARLRALAVSADRLTQRTHPKVLELLVTLRTDLDERVAEIRDANFRTMSIIAGRADARRCERILDDHERLLLTPEVFGAVKANPACPAPAVERAVAFLRMNRQEILEAPEPAPAAEVDLQAEIEAALTGKASPMLGQRQALDLFDLDKVSSDPLAGFAFDFADEEDFSMDLLEDRQGGASEAERLTIEKKIAKMSTGKKIKLAYLGNKEVRAILIRDRSKMVSAAVVKSGRLSDAEVNAYAGNRNLAAEVLREIAANKEWIRKYPVQVALVNNPRVPVSVSIGLVDRLLARDLASLARNRNVSSVIFQKAEKMLKNKGGAR